MDETHVFLIDTQLQLKFAKFIIDSLPQNCTVVVIYNENRVNFVETDTSYQMIPYQISLDYRIKSVIAASSFLNSLRNRLISFSAGKNCFFYAANIEYPSFAYGILKLIRSQSNHFEFNLYYDGIGTFLFPFKKTSFMDGLRTLIKKSLFRTLLIDTYPDIFDPHGYTLASKIIIPQALQIFAKFDVAVKTLDMPIKRRKTQKYDFGRAAIIGQPYMLNARTKDIYIKTINAILEHSRFSHIREITYIPHPSELKDDIELIRSLFKLNAVHIDETIEAYLETKDFGYLYSVNSTALIHIAMSLPTTLSEELPNLISIGNSQILSKRREKAEYIEHISEIMSKLGINVI